MFAGLKNKIKEETGKEVAPMAVRMGAQGRMQRSAFGSTSSQLTDAGFGGGAGGGSSSLERQHQQHQLALEQKELELAGVRLQCSESQQRADDSARLVEALRKDLERLEEQNLLLEESLRVAQSECSD